METEYARRFGAVDLMDALPVLARSERACASLREQVGAEQGQAAVEMLKTGRLDGDLGNQIYDFFVDEIVNEAREVSSGHTVNPDDEDDEEQHFPVWIKEYEGVYFVWALEYDPVGYFLTMKEADLYVMMNFENLR